MKTIKYYIFFFIAITIFSSCDPASSFYLSNTTNYKIYVEYEFNDFEIHHRNPIINNNFVLESGENKSLIYLFQETSIIRALGFGDIKNKEDITRAVNLIFNWINVYKITDDENIILYDKTYFLNENNIVWHKYPINYSIEFIIK